MEDKEIMAKLDSPLYGDTATGTLANVLAYRRRQPIPCVARLPGRKSPPSGAQSEWRTRYRNAIFAWNNLTPAERLPYTTTKPGNLTGFNFFLRMTLHPELSYFGYAIYGIDLFQLAPGPGQPTEGDYAILFPGELDHVPTVADGTDSPQAWLYNMAQGRLRAIQEIILEYAP